MLNKRTTIFQIIIIIGLIFTVQAALTMLFVIDYDNSVKRSYHLTATENIQSVSEAADVTIKNILADANAVSIDNLTADTAIPEGFDGVGYIDPVSNIDGLFYKMTLKIEGEEFTLTRLNNTTRTLLKQNSFSVYKLSELAAADSLTFNDARDFSVISNSLPNGGIQLLFFKHDSIVSSLNKYSFEDLYICFFDSEDFKFDNRIFSADETVTLPFAAIEQSHSDTNENFAYVSGNFYAFSGIGETGFCVVGFVSEPEIHAAVNALVVKMVVLQAAFLVFSVIMAMSVILFYTKKYNNLLFYKGKNNSNFVVKTNKYGKITYANEKFKQTFKVKNLFDHAQEYSETAAESLNKAQPFKVTLQDKNGGLQYLVFLNSATLGGYKFVGGNETDFMQRYMNAVKLNVTDETTGLLDESELKKLYQSISEEKHKSNKTLYGMISPLNIWDINTVFGKKFQQGTYKALGERIRELFGEFADIFFDGEHYLLLSKAGKADAMESHCNEFMDKLNNPLSVNNNLIKVNCRAGFAIIDKYLENYSYTNVRNAAESALTRASKGNILFYIYHQTQSMLFASSKSIDLSVAEYIENDYLDVHFQPQVDLSTGKICGFEALCRLKGAGMQDLTVQRFINIIERRGEMIELSEFIYDKALHFANEIREYDVEMSLNVSPVQMSQAGFADKFLQKYKSFNLPPKSVSIEITESFLMMSLKDILPKLQMLAKSDINIHLDDFGVEHSSFLYLQKLPIHVIKIDRGFVSDVCVDSYSSAIVETIISIAKKLELKCIAEGVETEDQKNYLKKAGCDIIQGYLIGPAVNKEKALQMLEASLGPRGEVCQ